jgi:hypothetical protein
VSAGVPKAVNRMQSELRAIREARIDPVTGERYCLCADPENCTQAIPGRICKAGRTIWQDSQSDRGADDNG